MFMWRVQPDPKLRDLFALNDSNEPMKLIESMARDGCRTKLYVGVFAVTSPGTESLRK
jgi:hypothetical protein